MQVKVLPITDRTREYAAGVLEKLNAAGVRAELDDRSEKIGYKIREAQLQKIPYMLVVGDKESEDGTVAVRDRRDGSNETMPLDAFLAKIQKEVAEKAL